MAKTFIEKVLTEHSGENSLVPGDIVSIEPDKVMSHDNTAFIIRKFQQTGVKDLWDKDKIAIIFDHCVPANKPEHKQNHDEVRKFVHRHNLPNFFDDKAGVCHQVMIESGLVLPGKIILGADSHSTLYGAIGALGIPINRTETAGIWATGKIWLKVPPTIKINLEGRLPKGVYAKDIILKLLSILKSDGANYKAVEFHGSTIKELTMSSRMTLANMAVELGAKAGIINYDDTTKEFLKGITNKDYTPIFPDKDAHYETELEINVEELQPMVACPHNVDNIKIIPELDEIRVDRAYLGSCTNGRLEDLKTAADILHNKRIHPDVRLVVYPASNNILKKAAELGIIKKLADAGAEIMTASCGPCFGEVGAILKDNQVCVSSSNRNFCGRMGSKKSFIYIASPAVVAASCIEGKIADPRKYLGRDR